MDSHFNSSVPTYVATVHSPPTKRLSENKIRDHIVDTVLRKNSSININIEDQGSNIFKTYSTNDEIRGDVELKFEKDVHFAEVTIAFEGQSTIFVEKVPATGPSVARKTATFSFLKLQQPLTTDDFPQDNICRAGQRYTIPFVFRVPLQLLPDTCFHKAKNEDVCRHHLKLPPSLAGSFVLGDGDNLVDDMTPNMARISYGICARVATRQTSGNLFTIAERVEKVVVVPRFDEEPPQHMKKDSFHALRCEKKVKKGFFRVGNAGSVVAETTQPLSLRLSLSQGKNIEPPSTTAMVKLRFNPIRIDDKPPQLNRIVTKLRVFTFFGVEPFQEIPEYHQRIHESPYHGVYSESFKLYSQNGQNVSTMSWIRHENTPSLESHSLKTGIIDVVSSKFSGTQNSSDHNSGLPFYTAEIQVPISLSLPAINGKSKYFLPTFHSCIISRTYTVKLVVSYNQSGSPYFPSKIVLKFPVQVSFPSDSPSGQHADIDCLNDHRGDIREQRNIETTDFGSLCKGD